MISIKTNAAIPASSEFTGPFTDDLIPPAFDRRDGKNPHLSVPVRAIRATEAAPASEAPKKAPPKLGAAPKATAVGRGTKKDAVAAPKAAKPAAAAKAAKPAKAAETPKAKGYNVDAGPKSAVTAAREGSGQALTLDLLARAKGATLADIVAMEKKRGSTASDTSIKTFLPTLVKMRGYGIRTTFDKSGETATYFLVLPTGMTAILPHKAKAEAAPAKKAPAKSAKKGAAK